MTTGEVKSSMRSNVHNISQNQGRDGRDAGKAVFDSTTPFKLLKALRAARRADFGIEAAFGNQQGLRL